MAAAGGVWQGVGFEAGVRSVAVALGNALALSIRAFAVLPLLKFREFFGINLENPPNFAVQYVVRFESMLGATLSAMAVFMVVRWFRRNLIPDR